MAGKIRHVAVGNNTYDLQGGNLRIFYGTCSTGATAQTKVVSIAEVSELETGDVFYVKMTNAQTYNGVPKLQINSLAAKNIARTGSVTASRYEWNAGEILEFVYDGTSMILVDGAIADTTYYGLTKLSSAVDSNSEEVAATSKAVKTAYDAANKTMTGATATAAGESGNVPQPAAGDQGKFLRGDGTWGEGSGTVDSVNNVRPDISKNVTLTGSDINVSSTDTTKMDAALQALAGKTGSDIPVSDTDSTTIASQIGTLVTAEAKTFKDGIEVTLPNVSDTNRTFAVTGITADHTLVQEGYAYLSNPSAAPSGLQLDTAAGTVTVSGTLTGTTNIIASLVIKQQSATGTAAS